MAEIPFTIAESGGNYTSISDYEVNEATNLSSAGDNHVVTCENFEDDTAFNISGFTTSASSNIVIQAETAHLSCGDYLENAYRLTTSSTVAGKIGDNHVHLIGLTLRKENDDDNYSAACAPIGSATSAIVEKCILLNEEDTTSGASPAAIRNSGNTHIEATFRNCVAISKRRGFNTLANGDWTLDNCTIIAGTNGTQISGNNDVVARNCYVKGGSGDDWASAITTTTCASSDSSGDTGLTSIAYSTANFVSVTAGSEDLRLVVGAADLIGGGTDLSSDFTDDIDGTTRSSWDVGADEFESAGEVKDLTTAAITANAAVAAGQFNALKNLTTASVPGNATVALSTPLNAIRTLNAAAITVDATVAAGQFNALKNLTTAAISGVSAVTTTYSVGGVQDLTTVAVTVDATVTAGQFNALKSMVAPVAVDTTVAAVLVSGGVQDLTTAVISVDVTVSGPKLFPSRADPSEYYRTVADGGLISVAAVAGIIGAEGLKVEQAAVTTGEVYVEKRARTDDWRFYIALDPNSISLADTDKHRIVSASNFVSGVELWYIDLIWAAGNSTWRIEFGYSTDEGPLTESHGIINIPPLEAPYEIEVWQTRGASAETGMRVWNHGLWTDPAIAYTTTTDIADVYRFGVNGVAENTVSNVFYLDHATLTSTPATAIGPLLVASSSKSLGLAAVAGDATAAVQGMHFIRSMEWQTMVDANVAVESNWQKTMNAVVALDSTIAAGQFNKTAAFSAAVSALATIAAGQFNKEAVYSAAVSGTGAVTTQANVLRDLTTAAASAVVTVASMYHGGSQMLGALAIAATMDVASIINKESDRAAAISVNTTTTIPQFNKEAVYSAAISIAADVVAAYMRFAGMTAAAAINATVDAERLNATKSLTAQVGVLAAIAATQSYIFSMSVAIDVTGGVTAILGDFMAPEVVLKVTWEMPGTAGNWNIPGGAGDWDIPGVTGLWVY